MTSRKKKVNKHLKQRTNNEVHVIQNGTSLAAKLQLCSQYLLIIIYSELMTCVSQ